MNARGSDLHDSLLRRIGALCVLLLGLAGPARAAAPIANPDSASTNEDTAVTINVTGVRHGVAEVGLREVEHEQLAARRARKHVDATRGRGADDDVAALFDKINSEKPTHYEA